MLKFEENVSLKPYNTFGIETQTKYFFKVEDAADLKSILTQAKPLPVRIFGGGSNLLLTQDFEGLSLLIANKGIHVLEENATEVTVEVQAGENWHDFVLWCLDQNYGGVENLSLIPGSVGAAPIQNIGAYGVELRSVFKSCTVLNIKTLEEASLSREECQFAYRSSVFKTTEKGTYIITSVCFTLQKPPHHTKIEYGPLKAHFKDSTPTIQEIASAVIAIRESKLPNPKILGNSGSFFKNPVVSLTHFNHLKNQYPELPSYPAPEGMVKIPAAWLIDALGFKGSQYGGAGVHKNQALVLVNLGGATGNDILKLAQKIQRAVEEAFQISLEMEVNVL